MNDIRKEVRELCDIIIKSGEAEFDYSELKVWGNIKKKLY